MRTRIALALAVALLAATAPARANPQPWNGSWNTASGVGLGVAIGADIPSSARDFKVSPDWGFFVDIPLLESFHITPSTMLYTLRPSNSAVNGPGSQATDVSLNFKFNIPVNRVDIFAGVTVGITSTESLDPHMGLLAGATYHFLPNLGLFAQVNYKYLFRSDDVGGNVHNVQIYAGPMFRF